MREKLLTTKDVKAALSHPVTIRKEKGKHGDKELYYLPLTRQYFLDTATEHGELLIRFESMDEAVKEYNIW